MSLLAWLVGCSSPEPAPPPPPPPVVRKPVMVVGEPAPGGEHAGGAGPVPVELQYVGVGELHQRWFGESQAVTGLAHGLGACMQGRAVVRTTWSEEERTGQIWLLLAGDQLTCRATTGAAGVDLTPLAPLGRALAAYRDDVAARFDFRVASFRVGIEVLQRTTLCRLQLGGQFPPDGSSFAPCVDMGGERRCVADDREGRTLFRYDDPQHTAYLARCLAP